MKVTVTVPIVRAGQRRELVMTRDGDEVDVLVPPAERRSRADYTVDVRELLAAAKHLATVQNPVTPPEGQMELGAEHEQ